MISVAFSLLRLMIVASNRVSVIKFPKIQDIRGNLTFIESDGHIPFEIKRVYWINDVPGGVFRGSHALKETEEVLIALSGSFDVNIFDGEIEKKYQLNRSYEGLIIPKMIWRYLDNFSTNAVCLVISSQHYNSDDYIRDKDKYIRIINGKE